MSPPASPSKSGLLGSTSDTSGASPMMSPIFKSATAKQIIEEVGKGGGGSKYKKKSKKRSFTINGGNPAGVLEALNEHQAKMV